jgi:DNA helicase II / ATP-dependent DNA helicase PcrA
MIRGVLTILQEMRAAYAEHQNIKTLLADIISSSGYAAMLENDDTLSSIEDIENLESYIQNLEEDTPLEGLLADILLTTYDQKERSGDVVSLVNAKNLLGRRFKTVFVCGLEEGIFPHYSAQFDTQILADEMAHFYRSITRATQFLYLTSAFQRSLYGEVKADDLSRWVLAFPKTILKCLISPKLQDKEIHQQLQALDFTCQIATAADADSESPTDIYSVGNWVSHPTWGKGIIQNGEGTLDQLVLTIAFADEERNLMAKYAPLTPTSPQTQEERDAFIAAQNNVEADA